MLVSLNCIKQFVDISGLTSQEIAKGLTFSGVEVEEIVSLASGTNLVIGHILECEPHPDSDHLHILKVDLGEKYGVTQIVCGAPNARKGLKVIVARVGAKLPQVEIKKGIIRGVESNGMCCSLLELGVDSKYLNEDQIKGIQELPSDALVGDEDVLGYFGLDDQVLNLSILANRPDLLSIYNVAREIGAIFNREVKIPSYPSASDFTTELKVFSLTSRCKQFSGKEIRDIKVKESPLWLEKCLKALGVRSINNIVDIGNYVMLLTGQPLHMYDADKIAKKELIVRDDFVGDFIALDDKSYAIKENDIVITSNNIPYCLGGVMGSKACEVDINTKNIIIESASFDSASIRRTSTRLGLVSESSQRFVKGTNHFQSEEVINFASSLIKELCDAKEESNIVSYLNETKKDITISSSKTRINARLGTDFSLTEIKDALTRLHFDIEVIDEDNFVSKVPSYRLDVNNDADLSEEVIRLLGFNNVKSILPTLPTKLGVLSLRQERERLIRYYLLDQGLDECLTYSLISKKEMNKFNLLNDDEHYMIINPLTDEHEVFRSHILHQLIKVASYNVNHQYKDLALFETANMITKSSRSEHLAIALVGDSLLQDNLVKVPYDFYDMKGLVEGIFTILGIEKSRYKFERLSSHKEELHPGKSAEIYFQNQLIGIFGEMHPNMIKEYDLGKNSVVILELDLERLLDAKVTISKMTPISKFPYVQRDLALLANKNIEVKDLIKTIKFVGKGIVEEAFVFDVYEGDKIDNDMKSVAISIRFRKDSATLTDQEVNLVLDNIKFELAKQHKAILRG